MISCFFHHNCFFFLRHTLIPTVDHNLPHGSYRRFPLLIFTSLNYRLMMYVLTAPSQTGVPWDASRGVPGHALFERPEHR